MRNLSTENLAVVHLYARWKANNYTVIFDGNGTGVTGIMGSQGFTYDAEQALTQNAFERAGYTFAGWNTAPDGNGTSYTDGQTVSNLATQGSTILYAMWSANTYNIALDDGYGTGGSGSVSATYGSALPAVDIPERTGYEFQGYYDGENGTGTRYYSADGNSAALWNKAYDTTLYAYWTPSNYTLIFHAAGGTVDPLSKTVTFGNIYGELPVPERSGYTFDGWFTASEGGTEINSGTTVYITENQDLLPIGLPIHTPWSSTPTVRV